MFQTRLLRELLLGVQSSLFTTLELKEVFSVSDFRRNSSALAGCMVLEAVAGVGHLKMTLET